MKSPAEVLAFWLDEMGPKAWYAGGDDIDARVRDGFLDLWEAAMDGDLGLWLTYPSDTLAYIILTDQFPRNMFRGTARAYASDPLARAAAGQAVAHGFDLKIDPPARQFFYMPFEHSESQTDQDRAVRLFAKRMPEAEELMLHARAHREVIRRFGRFPFRNEHLGRRSTPAEQAFMEAGAYGAMVRELKAAA